MAARRDVSYFVYGECGMDESRPSTWNGAASNATTFQELKVHLRAEPLVPKHFAMMVKTPEHDIWGTETKFEGKLPDGPLQVRIHCGFMQQSAVSKSQRTCRRMSIR